MKGKLPASPTVLRPTDLVDNSSSDGWGWYLYGITKRDPQEEFTIGVAGLSPADEPVVALPVGELGAIVQRVGLADFSTEKIMAHAGDATWFEQLVRQHERVVAAVHSERAFLPTKMGCVYPNPEDIIEAIRLGSDKLVATLGRVEGCDEWGVKLFADPAAIEALVLRDVRVEQAKAEIANATPGRAYFLQRKVEEAVASATESALLQMAQGSYDHLLHYAIAGEINQRSGSTRLTGPEVAILRASFLVRRSESPLFLEGLRDYTERHVGFRSEYSGPWAPYSFVSLDEDSAR